MAEDEQNKNYEDSTKEELLDQAQDRGLQVATSAKKDEIIEALKEDDKARIGAAAATEDEPFASVTYVGPDGLVCDALLPYQDDQAALVNGQDYSAPVSVIRQVVLNGNFTPAGNDAKNLLDREHARSRAGRLRAQRLLAGPAAGGETPEQFDQRVGIETSDGAGIAGGREGALADVVPESPEFDPMEQFFNEEA